MGWVASLCLGYNEWFCVTPSKLTGLSSQVKVIQSQVRGFVCVAFSLKTLSFIFALLILFKILINYVRIFWVLKPMYLTEPWKRRLLSSYSGRVLKIISPLSLDQGSKISPAALWLRIYQVKPKTFRKWDGGEGSLFPLFMSDKLQG